MPTVNLSDLDTAARAVRQAQVGAAYATVLIKGDPQEAERQIRTARIAATSALNVLEAMGATIPGPEDAEPHPQSDVPLHLMNTEATRELLAALEAAAAAGLKVDQERGWIDGDGDSIGHGDTLANMALALRTEIYGPADLRQE